MHQSDVDRATLVSAVASLMGRHIEAERPNAPNVCGTVVSAGRRNGVWFLHLKRGEIHYYDIELARVIIIMEK